MLGLAVYEAGVGPCGYHHSLTNDMGNFFSIENETCKVCAAAARFARIQSARDERAVKGEQPPEAIRPSDGRRTFVRQLSPLEVAARREQRTAARIQPDDNEGVDRGGTP